MTNDNIKYINKNSKERMVRELLEKKEDDYGHFPNNCYVVAKFIQGVLEIINKRELTVPVTLIPQLMIVLKLEPLMMAQKRIFIKPIPTPILMATIPY